MSATQMVWRVRPKSGGQWLISENMVDLGQHLADMVESVDSFELEYVEMTAAELEKAGEFDGW